MCPRCELDRGETAIMVPHSHPVLLAHEDILAALPSSASIFSYLSSRQRSLEAPSATDAPLSLSLSLEALLQTDTRLEAVTCELQSQSLQMTWTSFAL